MPVEPAVQESLCDKWVFLWLLPILVIGWILVELWAKFIDLLAYNTLGLNRESTFHAFMLAAVVTAIFYGITVMLGEHGDKLRGQIVGHWPTAGDISPI